MRIGRYEVSSLGKDGLWIGHTDEGLPVLARTAHRDDVYIYEQTRMLGGLDAATPFRLYDFVLDDITELAAFVLTLPGPVRKLADAVSEGGPLSSAVGVARALESLHSARIAYRNVSVDSFLFSEGWGIPHDFSRASQMGTDENARLVTGIPYDDRISAQTRGQTSFDAPEVRAATFDGVAADIYAFGILMRTIGLEEQYGNLVRSMTHRDPAMRPRSMEVVIATLLAPT